MCKALMGILVFCESWPLIVFSPMKIARAQMPPRVWLNACIPLGGMAAFHGRWNRRFSKDLSV